MPEPEVEAIQSVPGGSATLVLLVSVTAILVLVLLFAALLIGAHRRYRTLQESLRSEEREVERLRSEVDLWTESAKRLKQEAGDAVGPSNGGGDESEDEDEEDWDDHDPNGDTGELR